MLEDAGKGSSSLLEVEEDLLLIPVLLAHRFRHPAAVMFLQPDTERQRDLLGRVADPIVAGLVLKEGRNLQISPSELGRNGDIPGYFELAMINRNALLDSRPGAGPRPGETPPHGS